MIINQKVFVAVIAILSTTIESANVGENKNLCKSRDELDAKCGTYTYRFVRPMMEYFTKINREMELKDKKIANLEDAIFVSQAKSDNEIAKLIQNELELRQENTKLRDSLNIKQAEIAILQENLTLFENNSNEINNKRKKCELLNADNEYKMLELSQIREQVKNYKQEIVELTEKSEKCKIDLGNKIASKDLELSSFQNKLVECNKNLAYLPKGCHQCQAYYGIATVELKGLSPFTVSCDRRWTIIQRRIDGKLDFYRNWEEYKHGFGDFKGEYWIGLQRLHKMTYEKRHMLYIDLIDQKNEKRYAKYDNFEIGGEDTNFKLISLGKYTGNAKDSMRYHEGKQFSTYDRDNDDSSMSCPKLLKGGWWYWNCAFSNLNGRNFSCKMENSNQLEHTGCIYWQDWHGRSYSLKSVIMYVIPHGA